MRFLPTPDCINFGIGAFRAALLGVVMAIASMAFGVARAESIQQQPASPPAGKALIYLYRSPNLIPSLIPEHFAVDDIDIAKLNSRQYTWFYAPAGSHFFGPKKNPLELSIKEMLHGEQRLVVTWNNGQTYYYEFERNVGVGTLPGQVVITTILKPIDPEQASQELPLFHYVSSYNTDRVQAHLPLMSASTPQPSPVAPSTAAGAVRADADLAPKPRIPASQSASVAPSSAVTAIHADVDLAQKPRILDLGDFTLPYQDDPMRHFYPAAAMKDKVQGSAKIECQVTEAARLEECKVLSEEPQGYGFGEATIQLFSLVTLKPQTVQRLNGRPFTTAPVQWTLR
jgi:hypothetical protein